MTEFFPEGPGVLVLGSRWADAPAVFAQAGPDRTTDGAAAACRDLVVAHPAVVARAAAR